MLLLFFFVFFNSIVNLTVYLSVLPLGGVEADEIFGQLSTIDNFWVQIGSVGEKPERLLRQVQQQSIKITELLSLLHWQGRQINDELNMGGH
jgi:hypothetical protein